MWEWRVFGEDLAGLVSLPEAEPTEREDVYLLADGLPAEWNLKLRAGDRFEAKRRQETRGPLEAWTKVLSRELPVPPWEARALARDLTPVGRVPVRPLRSLQGLLDYLPSTGLGPARAVRVRKRIRRGIQSAVLAEHTSLEIAGRSLETVALTADDPDPLERALAQIDLPTGARVCSYPTLLAEGMP
jgi:hypothetical protein